MGELAKGEAWAVVTVDRTGLPLDGLSPLLSPRRRRRLAEAILLDVLQAVRDSRLIDATLLATRDPDASALGRKLGIPVSAPPAQHTAEASLGGRAVTVALLRGDLALFEAQDLAFLLGRVAQGTRLVLVPTPGSPGLSAVVARSADAFIADFEAGTFRTWEGEARQRALASEIHAIPAGIRPSGPRDLLEVYMAGRPSRAKALLKDWQLGPALRKFKGEGA